MFSMDLSLRLNNISKISVSKYPKVKSITYSLKHQKLLRKNTMRSRWLGLLQLKNYTLMMQEQGIKVKMAFAL